MNSFYSKARSMSTGHKGSVKTALTSALKYKLKTILQSKIKIGKFMLKASYS